MSNKNNNEIGWNFPSNGGGAEAGFNDSGIETYTGKPFESLAREAIQNSLDARDSLTDPVTVAFELEEIPSVDLPGHAELLDAMKKCEKETKDSNKANSFFLRAIDILKKPKIACLVIKDYGTTGLRDGKNNDVETGQWHRLVKATGQSAKDNNNTAGGSYGIGKHAPFVVSGLRTVFYSTRYIQGGRTIEKAQGRAILISHQLNDGNKSQAVGFYGQKARCEKLTGEEIPPILKHPDDGGTTLLIPGLNETKNWQEKIAAAVISNYFHAIRENDLTVLIDKGIDKGHPYIEINSETLPELLDNSEILKADESNEVGKAKHYYNAICEGEVCETELTSLGHCVMRLTIGEGQPQRVAILRHGMKITDGQKGLIQWHGCSDFTAVCECLSEKGQSLLRRMENPAHDAFEPARLGNDSRKGTKILNELTKWIRETIKNATSNSLDGTVDLDTMSEYFPSPDDDKLAGESETDFDGDSSVKPKPSPKPTPIEPEDTTVEEEDENGLGGEGGDSPNGEEGDGENTGGDIGGDNGGSGNPRNESMKVEAIRVLHVEDNKTDKYIMFTPKQTGKAKLSIMMAGDSFTEDIGGIASVLNGEHEKTENGYVVLPVTENKRVKLKVRLKESFRGSLSIVLLSCKE